MELPIAFEARMKRLLGTDYDAFYVSLTEEGAVKGLRVNAAKLDEESFRLASPFPLAEIPYVKGGFIVSEEDTAGKHPYHHAGAYYMQDPGAMATAAALPTELLARERLRVLDLCSAPGGKTTQIAAMIAKGGGILLSNEYNAARSRILAGNVERMGLSNVLVTNLDTGVLAELYPMEFDLVVCDAPCSGEGMFRKNDRAILEWSEANVTACALRQREILRNGAVCVASGGYLLYSTCTYAVEENEAVISAFLAEHPDFSLVPVRDAVASVTVDGETEGFSPDMAMTRRFYPHVSRGEGQFVALLRRDAEALPQKRRGRTAMQGTGFALPSKGDLAVAEAFLRETLGHTLPAIGFRGGMLLSIPAWAEAPLSSVPIGTVALGAAIGELRKGRLVPHHHFFMAFGAEMMSRAVFEPTDPQVALYLAGEEISVPESCKGYTAVMLRVGNAEITLGGGKASGGRLKNYYPKGLRVR